MNVLITGGAGFVGSHTAELLLNNGHSVRVLDDFSSSKRNNLPKYTDLEIVEGDIRDTNCVRKSLRDITHVLHLAAQVSVQASNTDPLKSNSINLTGFLNVLHEAMNAKISRFVYASSAAVYGIPDQLPLTEFSSVQPTSIYGVEKAANDEIARIYNSLYGTLTLGLRYFNIYGTRQNIASPYTGVITKFIQNIETREPLMIYGDGRQTRDFIHVKTIARINILALQGTAVGVCNIGTGSSISLIELIEVIAEIVNYHPQIIYAPSVPGDIKFSSMDVTRMKSLFGHIEPTVFKKAISEIFNAS